MNIRDENYIKEIHAFLSVRSTRASLPVKLRLLTGRILPVPVADGHKSSPVRVE